jgi:hypothetical protein
MTDENRPVLTIAMVDALMETLSGDWTCPAGYTHEPSALCLHILSPAARKQMLRNATGLRRRLVGLHGAR